VEEQLWIVLLGWIAYYVRRDAFHYLFRYTPESFKAFWSERIVIRTRIAAAIVMASTGALQFWTGLRFRNMTLHRWCGRVFLVSGTFAVCEVLYMSSHPREGGVVYGVGLFLNGLFWLAAASMAYYAIRIGNVQVHKEWMIRTYILTCAGLIGPRAISEMPFLRSRIGLDAANDLSTWVGWVVPLMVAEILIQRGHLRRDMGCVRNERRQRAVLQSLL
jgi:uncharacterized membrane protein